MIPCTLTDANYERVLAVMKKHLVENEHICRCSRCVSDIAAHALNCLSPHYHCNAKMDTGAELGSSWAMVELSVSEAIERVMKNPRHTCRERE